MTTERPPGSITLREAARFWARLGWVSFGGPAGQIALLHSELVQRRRWLSERRFLHALNYCMVLPGPEATQLASYLGWLMHGVPGGLVAGGLFLLPSVLVLLSLASIYALWGQLPVLTALFWALKPAVLAIVLQAAWRLGRRTLHTPLLVAIALAALLGLALLQLPYPLLLAGAALLGALAARFRPHWIRAAGAHGAKAAAIAAPQSPALHDDLTPAPPHARFSRRGLALALLAGGLALGLPLAALALADGWHGLLATMARFFTRVALLSFGGAYAVLPYVARWAVEEFGWLSAAQMVDGLALGETTPGPLIMVVAFVGFMGGWHEAGDLVRALTAGLVVVWFTFLPSFVFILAGAPLVEASREDLRLDGPLTAITAVVVGVIVSLALFFAGPVLLPQGQIDPGALALLLAALVLLLGRGWSVLQLIGAAALVGVLRAGLLAAGLLP
ncbi:chromate efflux transporter [Cyanobium sp. FGCU-6]|nr:chromate efflux transporter [Cyanobium sp. FGCU6]